jgi:hypothetical protein
MFLAAVEIEVRLIYNAGPPAILFVPADFARRLPEVVSRWKLYWVVEVGDLQPGRPCSINLVLHRHTGSLGLLMAFEKLRGRMADEPDTNRDASVQFRPAEDR